MINMEQRIATWVSMAKSVFCGAYGLSHQQFLDLDERFGLLRYLFSNYELLHYYGNEAITEDIVRHIKEQGGAVDAVS